jgi:hypothetical protein
LQSADDPGIIVGEGRTRIPLTELAQESLCCLSTLVCIESVDPSAESVQAAAATRNSIARPSPISPRALAAWSRTMGGSESSSTNIDELRNPHSIDEIGGQPQEVPAVNGAPRPPVSRQERDDIIAVHGGPRHLIRLVPYLETIAR